MQHSNSYTFIYAIVFTAIVAVLLATLSTGLKPIQDENRAHAKRVSILSSVQDIDASNKVTIAKTFDTAIEGVVVDVQGNPIADASAFDVDIAKESGKPINEQRLPLYIYTQPNGEKNYIIPLRGSGLWGWISVFVALESDLNTIKSVVFDHEGETPGLGAEIKDASWYPEQFKGKKFFDESGNFVSITTLKGRGNTLNEHQVDGISGATITSVGVSEMLTKMKAYQAYFKSLK